MQAHTSHWENRRVLITGGSRGLGRALAENLTVLGSEVAVIARSLPQLKSLQSRFPRLHILQGDIGEKEDTHRLALSAMDSLGGLDLLIHNAGILGPSRLKLLADTDCEDFEAALQVHVLGPFRLTKALLGPLMESKGIVTHITSDAALTPYSLWGAYGASKAAMQQMAAIWNEEMRDVGVQMVNIDPGDMLTDLHLQAIPQANPQSLKSPQQAAVEIIHQIGLSLTKAETTKTQEAEVGQ